MSQLTDNLSAIAAIKSDIAAAIENKGVSMSGVSFGSYADKIVEIQTGGTFVTETLSVSVNNTYYPGQGVDGFSQVIVDVPQSVTGWTEKDLTEGVVISALNNSASYVTQGAWQNNTALMTVNLPNCTVVMSDAFIRDTNLSSISLPVCENISNTAFLNTGLVSVYLPSCKSIGQGNFMSCMSLTQVEMPELISAGNYTFSGCTRLISVSLQKLISTAGSMFYNCTSLTDVYIPNVRFVANFAFNNCSNLESVDFLPECLSLDRYAFANCYKISYVNLPYCTYIGSSAFNNCSSLTTVSLPLCINIGQEAFNRKSITELDFPMCVQISANNFMMSIVTKVNLPILRNISAQHWNPSPTSLLSELSIGNRIYYTPDYISDFSALLSNGGSIYVDAAMWDKWLSASGWSSLSAAFVSFGDANEPMLSFSDGTVYGKTWGLWYGFVTSSIINVAAGQVTALDLSQCRYINAIEYSAITSINLPECRYLGDTQYMYHLETVNLPKCEVLSGTRFFYDCGNSASIYLGSGLSTVCKLNLGQGYRVGNVKFYVPSSLVDAYMSAYGWSSISSRIYPIE